MERTLPVLLTGFLRLAIGRTDRLEWPVAEHIAIGTCLAVRVTVARHVNGGTLARTLIADRRLALVVVFAVAAWVLVLANGHGFLAKCLFLFLLHLGSVVNCQGRVRDAVAYRV